jgi:hypothetical protein
MANMKLIKPNELYAGLPQGWWLKNYWEYVYPLIIRAPTKAELLPAPDEHQAGPVMYAVGRYARAFAEPERVVKFTRYGEIETETYNMTMTISKGFLVPFVKFIALESDGDGSSFAELRNAIQSVALDSDVQIKFKVTDEKENEIEVTDREGKKQHSIDRKNAMEYYCESDPIDLPAPLYGQPGYSETHSESHTNRAVSCSFMAIFEPQEEGTYYIDVGARYLFRDRGKSKDYGSKDDGTPDPLRDRYEIKVTSPTEKKENYRRIDWQLLSKGE